MGWLFVIALDFFRQGCWFTNPNQDLTKGLRPGRLAVGEWVEAGGTTPVAV